MLNNLKNKINSDSHFKEILRGSAVTFVLKISGILLGYLVVLIISRNYGAEGIGVYNLTLNIMTLMAMMASMGINVSILRYVGQFNNRGEEYKLKLLYRYAVELVVPFSLFLSILLYFFAGIIAGNVFHNLTYKPALEFVALIVPFLALQNISVEFIRGLKKLKISEFLRSVNPLLLNILLLLIIGLFIIDQMLPLYTLGIGIALSTLFSVFYIVNRVYRIEYKSIDDFSKKELISTSIPMLINAISLFLMTYISIFLLEVFSTTEDVGIFSIAVKLSTLISLILIVINTMFAPKISELYWNKRYEELQNVIYRATKLVFIVSSSIAIILISFSDFFLSLFGKEFILGNSVLVILVVGQLINAICGSVGIILNMTGHQKVLRNILIFSVFISIILNYTLIRKYGINGAAVASVVSMALWNILATLFIKYKLNITTFYIPWKYK